MSAYFFVTLFPPPYKLLLSTLSFLSTIVSIDECMLLICLSAVRRTHVSGPRRDAADGRLQQSRLSRVLVAHVAMATVQRQLWVGRGRADEGGGVRAGQPEPCQRLQVRLTSFLYWKVVYASSWILCRQRQSLLNRIVVSRHISENFQENSLKIQFHDHNFENERWKEFKI